MRAIVKEVFIDKYTDEVYEVGKELNLDDADRIKDLEERKLIEVIERQEPVKKASVRRKKASKD